MQLATQKTPSRGSSSTRLFHDAQVLNCSDTVQSCLCHPTIPKSTRSMPTSSFDLSLRRRPTGCAFASLASESTYAACPIDAQSALAFQQQESKTITDLLYVEPLAQKTATKASEESLLPADTDVLAAALGAPARRVLLRAEAIGPLTGWKDGHLSSKHGFMTPDISESRIALSLSPGRVWMDLCARMPALVARGKVRDQIKALPVVLGKPQVIPDSALWAAIVTLGILAHSFRYEERNDGFDGISFTLESTGDGPSKEEPETKGLPPCIALPLRQISSRAGRPFPFLSMAEITVYNYKVRDPTSVDPFLQRRENMDLMWPVFNDISEQTFNLCVVEVNGCCRPIVELIATCQEKVMLKDNQGLLHALVGIKECIDQLSHIFHKNICVNPNAGENFTDPVVWGARYAKWTAPLSTRVPMVSGLTLPLFQLMDVFLGRVKYDSFLGAESFHARSWLPMNVRAFIAAIQYHYPIHAYVMASGDPCLQGIFKGIVESYAGERGFIGTHRYKVYGFLEIVAKTGRAVTNGNPEAGKTKKLWQETHTILSNAMQERLHPYCKDISVQPHEMRGSFEECQFSSRVIKRASIDRDPMRTTGMVTFDLVNTGITFRPGDRLAVMPWNSQAEIDKVVSALGMSDLLEQEVPLLQHSEWKRFAIHMSKVGKTRFSGTLSVHDVLRRGHLAPLTKGIVMEVYNMLQRPSTVVEKVLASDLWPVRGSLGDLLQIAVAEPSPESLDKVFDRSNVSWLLSLVPVEVPRTYSISSFSQEFLPPTIDLTVARSAFNLSPVIAQDQLLQGCGVSSGFLNPVPLASNLDLGSGQPEASKAEPVLIGISQPLNFQLPTTSSAPIVMFAGGSGIAPFRGFWQARAGGSGRNILFLGVQSRARLLYEEELLHHIRRGDLELHVAFSRDRNGLQYNPVTKDMDEKPTETRYIDAVIVEYGKTVYDMIMPKQSGGLGGYLYICGSVSLYETVMTGIKRAMYNNQNVTKAQAEELVATAFAERRFMLDIFMTPQQLSLKQKEISLAELARNTGHKPGTRLWIGVHGSVYDITEFLPLHPGGSFIAAASGGIDASEAFDDLAHTNNPEVASLLTKYFLGNLAPVPRFTAPEVSALYGAWSQYLRTSVELLTTIGLEAQDILENPSLWISGGMLDSGGIRKFYQFQSRLMKGVLAVMFGAQFQEIYLQLSCIIVDKGFKGTRLADVLGSVTQAQESPASAKVSREIAQIGKWVCNSHEVQYHEKSLLRYAKTVTRHDLAFLESIRDLCAAGLEAFDDFGKGQGENEDQKYVQLATLLLSVLHKLAARLDTFYQTTAMEPLLRPESELNPARTRWNIIRSKIDDGSFFILCQPLELGAESNRYRSWRQILQNVKFKEIIVRAKETVVSNEYAEKPEGGLLHMSRPAGLAAAHIARASNDETSSFESQLQNEAMQRIAQFMEKNSEILVGC